MKKYIYYLLLGAATMTACNPMEDINDEVDQNIAAMKQLQLEQASQTKLDAATETFVLPTADLSILNTTTSEDPKKEKENKVHLENKAFLESYFALQEKPLTAEESAKMLEDFNGIAKHSSFNANLDERTVSLAMGAVLVKKFNAAIGQQVKVMYPEYNPLSPSNLKDTYTLVQADYGGKYSSFSSNSYLSGFVTKKYKDVVTQRGDYVLLTYKWYNSKTKETSDYKNVPFIYDGKEFLIPTILPADDYYGMQQSHANFESIDDAKKYMPGYYTNKNIFAKEGDVLVKAVKIYKKDNYEIIRLKYTNGAFSILEDTYLTGKNFVYVKGATAYQFKWQYIPEFKCELADADAEVNASYKLKDADYELVGLGRYKNFDMEPTHSDWAKEQDPDVFLEKFTTILKVQLKSPVIGSVVEVTYNEYTKATGTVEKKVKLKLVL